MITTMGAKTVLVVDDEEGLRKVAVVMLSRLGYDVLEARDGPSALKVLGQDGKALIRFSATWSCRRA